MLKVKIVSTRVRTAAWCSTHRKPSAMSWRRCDSVSGVSGVVRQREARDQHRAEQHEHGLDRERPGHAHGEQRRTDRRPDQLVDGDEAGLEPRVGDGQVVAVRRASAAGCWTRCPRTSPRCRAGTWPAARARSRRCRWRSRRRAAPARRSAAGRRSSRSAVGPGGRSAHRRTGRRAGAAPTAAARPGPPGTSWSVCEATSSGPAARAMPSPTLLIQEEASSHRKPVPSRAGATVSRSLLTGATLAARRLTVRWLFTAPRPSLRGLGVRQGDRVGLGALRASARSARPVSRSVQASLVDVRHAGGRVGQPVRRAASPASERRGARRRGQRPADHSLR